jgi:hypothetical protein
MTNRLTCSVSSALFFAALRFGLLRAQRVAPAVPEMRVRPAEAAFDEETWLFGESRPAFAAETFLLDQAMSRAAGSLAVLRGVLSRLSRHAIALAAEPDFAPSLPGAMWPEEDADLFDAVPSFMPRAAENERGEISVY